MPVQKYFLPLVVGSFLFVLILLTLILNLKAQGLQKKTEDASRVMPNFQPKIQRPLDTSGFSTFAYIRPLESNAQGSIYSSRVQMRGTVDLWKNSVVRIKISEEVKDVQLPVAVRLYCTPPFFFDKEGKKVPAESVALDFSKFPDAGVLFSTDTLSGKIPKGKDVTVLANVGDGDVMTAYLVVGYGCQAK